MGVDVEPISDHIGARITGVTSSGLADGAVADAVLAALATHGVLVFPTIDVSPADFVAFTHLLGTVVNPPRGTHPEHPEIDLITRDPEKSKLAGYREGTFYWHIDGTYDPSPNKATLLSCITVADGDEGDTEFASTYAAYEAMPAEMKARIDDLKVVHSFAASQSYVHPNPSEKLRAAWAEVPVRVHPLVWRRRDGRRSLLIGSSAGEIVGMDPAESRTLLDELMEWTTQPQFCVRHRWTRGDLVMFDNTGLLHRALPYPATSQRLMYRITLAGEEVIG